MKPENISLFFQQGTSDKVYNVKLLSMREPALNPYETEDIWYVCFQYGRRGSSLVNGKKNQTGLSYWAAKRLYDTLVRSKVRKGYLPKTDGKVTAYTPFTEIPETITNTGLTVAKRTDFLPQLLNQITLAEAKKIYKANEGNIYMQIKHDGERRGILIKDKVIAANRKGMEVQIQQNVADACKNLTENWQHILEFDTEDMGSHLVIFDVLNEGGEDIRNKPFEQRVNLLTLIQMNINAKGLEHQLKVDMAYVPDNMNEFLDYINYAKETNEEGVVIRIGAGTYEPGKPNSGGYCFKLKFYADATVRVTTINQQRSIGISVIATKQGGQGTMQFEVGNCAIPANREIPEIGDLVEVRYLYAYPGGSLYQPFYKGLRADKNEADHADSLQYKKETK